MAGVRGPRRRKEILEEEAARLAPFAMRSSSTRGRAHREPESEYRTPFQRDRDRIVHSTAFRRLEYKTQVFVNHEGDHYRTRLTHTLEVAQISRGIARALGLNEDLVECIALAHDLGHPPFGHAGEDALDELMEADGGFNHNRKSLRVVDRLEKRYPGFDGLNLSFEIRESIAKHRSKRPFPLGEEFEPATRPLLEAQLVDLADSLAYNNHDVDDGLRSDFVGLEELREVRLWREVEAQVSEEVKGADPKVRVARMVSRLIDLEVRDLIDATLTRLERAAIDSAEKVRRHPEDLVGFTAPMQEGVAELAAFLNEKLYRHFRILKMAEKAKRFITEIFREYQRNPGQLPPSFHARIAEEGRERVICDYLAGMTDRFCQDEYKRLFYPFERM
jgi:dGTPase